MDEEVAHVMQKLCDIFGIGNVILAGGAIRDWELRKPIKDYDFFINNNTVNGRQASDMMSMFAATRVGEEGEEYPDDGCIAAVYNANQIDKALQFIFVVGDPRDYVRDKFDYNLCMCYYSPLEEGFKFYKEFREGVRERHLVKYKDNVLSRMDKPEGDRQNRMRNKFEEYTFSIQRKESVWAGGGS